MYFVKAPESGSVESSDDGRTVADAAAEASRRPFCRWAQLGKASRGGAIAPIGAWGFKLTPDRGENRGPSDGMGDREVMVSGIEKRVYPTYTGRRQVKIPMCVPLSESEPFLLLTAGDDTPDQS